MNTKNKMKRKTAVTSSKFILVYSEDEINAKYFLLALLCSKFRKYDRGRVVGFLSLLFFFESDNCVLQYVSGVYALYHRGTELKITQSRDHIFQAKSFCRCVTAGLVARIPVSSRFFLHLSRLQADFFFYDAAREPGIIEKISAVRRPSKLIGLFLLFRSYG